jgi:hypothetical protein
MSAASLEKSRIFDLVLLSNQLLPSTIHPGDVLLVVDHTGSGHKWRLINDEPWKRAYVIFKPGADTQFVPDPA